MSGSPHDVLGVAPGASREEVHAAYRRLAREHHPDRFAAAGDDVRRAAERRMQEVTGAYHALLRAPARPAVEPDVDRAEPRPAAATSTPPPLLEPALPFHLSRRMLVTVALLLVVAIIGLAVLASTSPSTSRSPSITPVDVAIERGRFVPPRLVVAAGTPIALRVDNRDSGYQHSVTVESRNGVVFRGAPVSGPVTVVYSLPPLAPGSYTVRDEVFGASTATLVARANP